MDIPCRRPAASQVAPLATALLTFHPCCTCHLLLRDPPSLVPHRVLEPECHRSWSPVTSLLLQTCSCQVKAPGFR